MPKDKLDEILDEIAPKTLGQKLALIRQAVPNIEKKGHNATQKYDFMRAEDICGEIGDRLAMMNITMAPIKVQVVAHDIITVKRQDGTERRDMHILLIVTYRFLDGDTQEVLDVEAAGEGIDTSDKASNKAMTSAKKYALSQSLTLRVGDDVEADETAGRETHQPAPPNASAPAPARVATTPVYHVEGAKGSPISQKQRTRMFAIAKGNVELIKEVQKKWGYASSNDISWKDYDPICKEIERQVANPEPVTDESDIPF